MLSWFISKRFRTAGQHKGLGGFLSKASTVGVLIGVSVLIVSLSVINGFEQQLVKRLLSVVAHVEYHAPDSPMKHWPSKVAILEQHEHVVAATPQINLTAMIQNKSALKALQVEAVLPSEYHKVSDIDQFIEGKVVSSLNEDEIVLGNKIASAIGAELGSKVTLLIADKNNAKNLAPSKRITLTVTGLIKMGGPLDQSLGIMHLAKAQMALGFAPDEITDIRVSVEDVFAAHQIAMQAGQQLPDLVYVSSWFRSQGSLYQDIQMVRTIIYIVVFLIIAVASFNIVSSMVMEVKEKQDNIAILKTMGARDSTIFTTFALQGLSYAMVGAVLGVCIGVLIAMNVSDFFTWWVSFSDSNPLEDVYFLNFLPSVVLIEDIVITVSVTMAISIIATLYPAWQATKVEPAKVLGN